MIWKLYDWKIKIIVEMMMNDMDIHDIDNGDNGNYMMIMILMIIKRI